jgi:hypothetical protein
MPLRFLTCACACAAIGCGADYANLRYTTAQHVGCPESAVRILSSERTWNRETWRAECQGRRYVCGTSGKPQLEAECKPAS